MVTKQAEVVKADVLCIGGGPAGLMAAIRARELGASVVVADKGNTLHSGSATGGCDHFMCYNPEYHGTDVAPIREAVFNAPTGGCTDPVYVDIWLDKSFEMVKLWESWGIPMKHNGKWDFGGHSFPDRPRIHMHYAGGNQKKVLTEKALKNGGRLMNRVTIFELLRDGDRVIGALGFDTWNERIIQFEAKSTMLATGLVSRLYPGLTPGWLINIPIFPFNTGDGRAMGLRAGAYLTGLEFAGRWAGPKYFSRAGKGTWIGVLREPSGKPVGPFITKPNKETGDIVADVYPALFADYAAAARGPVYMDLHGASKEDIEYMLHWLRHEGNTGLVNHLAQAGIDLTKNGIEFGTYEFGVRGGVWHTPDSATNLKGLYACGEEYAVLGGMAGAVTLGWMAGENMANHARGTEFAGLEGEKDRIEQETGRITAMLSRKAGASWQEANVALQNTMLDYGGGLRSEPLLAQGLSHLARVKEKAAETLMARNGHELGRCLEVLNLMEVGEAVITAARARQESRGPHKRYDYPYTNPLLDRSLLVSKEAGKFAIKWGEKMYKGG